MNRIVRENYPVADLPEDLRSDLGDVTRVRVVLEPMRDGASVARPSLAALLAMGRPAFGSFDEVVAHIGTMRSEWD